MATANVGVTPVLLAPSNAGRRTFSIRNTSAGVQKVSLDNTLPDGLTTTNAGYLLVPGEALHFILAFDGKEIKQPRSAVSDIAGATVLWKELSE